MTVFRSAVVRFQGLAFAIIAKTSDAMVGHKASRGKGTQFGRPLFHGAALAGEGRSSLCP